jgi:hypothetical protein
MSLRSPIDSSAGSHARAVVTQQTSPAIPRRAGYGRTVSVEAKQQANLDVAAFEVVVYFVIGNGFQVVMGIEQSF